MRKKHALIISAVITGLIACTIFLLSTNENNLSQATVARVIDGDTVVLNSGTTVRLLNINAPEKNTPESNLSKSFLKLFENKTLNFEFIGQDKYKRTLARVYSPDYINLKLVELGFSSKFLVEDSENKIFNNAEDIAVKNNKGIWKKSTYSDCFSIDINKKQEILSIENKCGSINMKDWQIKDESRKIYTFKDFSLKSKVKLHSTTGKDNSSDIFWNSATQIWNDDKDTVYLFDSKGALAYHESYGY